jgi:hypothetical protein
VHAGLQWGKPEGKNNLKDLGVNGRIKLKWVSERFDEGSVDWTDLAQDRDKWRALVNTVINLPVP